MKVKVRLRGYGTEPRDLAITADTNAHVSDVTGVEHQADNQVGDPLGLVYHQRATTGRVARRGGRVAFLVCQLGR